MQQVRRWVYRYALHNDTFVISLFDESLCGLGDCHAATEEPAVFIPDPGTDGFLHCFSDSI